MVLRSFINSIRNTWKNRAVRKVEKETVRVIKEYTPVDTGRLRDSVEAEIVGEQEDNIEIIVKSDVEYARFVEFGTRFVAGRFMFTRGVDHIMVNAPDWLKDSMENGKAQAIVKLKNDMKRVIKSPNVKIS
jgi:HK97 gp10 family phage protein